MNTWIEPTLVGAAALVLAGGAGYSFRHLGRVFRHAVGEVVVAKLTDFKVELDKRFDHNDGETEAAKALAADLKLELAKQFGGNGNGIRQAVNGLSTDVAALEGAFKQHVTEAGK